MHSLTQNNAGLREELRLGPSVRKNCSPGVAQPTKAECSAPKRKELPACSAALWKPPAPGVPGVRGRKSRQWKSTQLWEIRSAPPATTWILCGTRGGNRFIWVLNGSRWWPVSLPTFLKVLLFLAFPKSRSAVRGAGAGPLPVRLGPPRRIALRLFAREIIS